MIAKIPFALNSKREAPFFNNLVGSHGPLIPHYAAPLVANSSISWMNV
jgi:hypothetical protein